MAIHPATDDLIRFLNEISALDPVAIRALIEARVPCNAALAAHPTVQVGGRDGGGTEVGFLGLLNGFCGTVETGPREGWGPIAAVFEDSASLRFERTDSPSTGATAK